ncbi:MAG: hypothetical protein EBT47_13660, partial [Chloroflexi bacterium]|nr:hypothetical protein [Chloroflexota bacterium]
MARVPLLVAPVSHRCHTLAPWRFAMIPEPLEALGRVFEQLEIKHDFEDERLLTGFGGTNAP